MAEGLLRHFAGDRFDIYSAGLHPRPIQPMAIEVMKEIDIDIGRQYSKSITEFLESVPKKYGVFYTVILCGGVEKGCPNLHPFDVNVSTWPFADPSAGGENEAEKLERFRRVRNQIEKKIEDWLKSI